MSKALEIENNSIMEIIHQSEIIVNSNFIFSARRTSLAAINHDIGSPSEMCTINCGTHTHDTHV